MRGSVFSAIREYLQDVYRRFQSIWGSLITAVPYLWGVGEQRKEVTEQYPDPVSSRTADDLPARSRGLLVNDIDRCTGCKECEKICPVQCIRVDTEAGADQSKLWVARFDIDYSKCVFCGLCVEVCHPQSLVHSKKFEGSVYELKDLVASFGRGFVTAEQRAKWAAMRQQAENDEVFP
ncbi:MAG: 4Fe-4S binding protein [Oligoflexia bacterium]|nr:4Fe-4S binding protein [Oligoflexia bacterium]